MNLRFYAAILITLILPACGGERGPEAVDAGSDRSRPLIIASNYPLYYFAREIAGDSAEVVFPSMDGDPANWKPGAGDIAQMQSADLLILNGAGYESWLGWVSLPDDILLDTSAGVSDRLIVMENETLHQHGPAGEHSHGELAFTTWLDPLLAMEQAGAIEQAISDLVPQSREANQARLNGLQGRLAELDKALKLAFENLGGQPLIFSHPVYQYLEARYGLHGVSMHWEPGEEPGTRAWIDFRKIFQSYPAELMIWEDEPTEKTASQLEKLGVTPVPFHTASNLPQAADYFEVMNANVSRLKLFFNR